VPQLLAYIDPGSGSLIIQVVIATLVVAVVALEIQRRHDRLFTDLL